MLKYAKGFNFINYELEELGSHHQASEEEGVSHGLSSDMFELDSINSDEAQECIPSNFAGLLEVIAKSNLDNTNGKALHIYS